MFKQGVVHALVTIADQLSANPRVAASEVVFAHSGDKLLGRLDELSFSVRLVEFVPRYLVRLWVGDEPLKPLVSEGFD